MLQPDHNQEPMCTPFYALEGPAVHITHAPGGTALTDGFQRCRPSSYNTNTLCQSLHHQNRGPQCCCCTSGDEMVQQAQAMQSKMCLRRQATHR